MCVCWIVEEWARISKDKNEKFNLQSNLVDKFSNCLQEFIFFDEIGSLFTRVQHETRGKLKIIYLHLAIKFILIFFSLKILLINLKSIN